MDEEKKDELTAEQQEQHTSPDQQESSKPSYTPASKGKRIAAWVGVVLMIILVILYSYSLATGAFLSW